MPISSAQSILSTIWKENDFPVDPVWIAGELGIQVLEADLPEKVSGALIKEKGKDPIILLCSSDSKNRKRFTCAHEIGHYISRLRNDEEYSFIDLRNEISSNGQKEEEIFANRFAANLLMPENAVKELFKQDMPSIVMAYRFGVSDEAMNHRLNNLKLFQKQPEAA